MTCRRPSPTAGALRDDLRLPSAVGLAVERPTIATGPPSGRPRAAGPGREHPGLEGRRLAHARERAAGRRCAARALAATGLPAPGPLPRRDDGAPAWPAGAVGSISHTPGLVAAAAASATALGAIGLDVETGILPVAAAGLVCDVDERDRWASCVGGGGALGATLAFSARESVFKALSAAGIALGAPRATTIRPTVRGFRVHRAGDSRPCDAAGLLDALDGRWTVRDGVVATAVLLLAADAIPGAGRAR
ncbi:hypothetical protein AB0L40_08030 [Patulibacter sp. NPDC049589]|uniref:hypothetical protein n=1 Tax=Patulibacter sp. NPDC049589 TaxID=3154731 RepID=UPI003446855E